MRGEEESEDGGEGGERRDQGERSTFGVVALSFLTTSSASFFTSSRESCCGKYLFH